MAPHVAAGPSRRSHTKSRKGCKTCKRRHIRCDESFPQCRNCTKHQVRCDYQDAPPSEAGGLDQFPFPEAPVEGLFYSPEIESILKHWQLTGEATLGDEDVSVDLHAGSNAYSLSDLHLLYHTFLFFQEAELREFSIFASALPLFLEVGKATPFVVHAVLAISAAELSWETSSSAAKNLSYHHGGVALKGVQDAIAVFSPQNAEAILVASVLLSWQANDWRSFNSFLQSGYTIARTTKDWDSSQFVIPMLMGGAWVNREATTQLHTSDQDFRRFYGSRLQQISRSLAGLNPYILGRPDETRWVAQLQDYLQRLLRLEPASTTEEQFNHLYTFRKWLLWVPGLLMKSNGQDPTTLLVISYLYATALHFRELFPDIGHELVSRGAVPALTRTLQYFGDLQSSPYQPPPELVQLLSFPQEALSSYHVSRQPWTMPPSLLFSSVPHELDDIFSNLESSIGTSEFHGSHSPGFTPLHAPRGSIGSESMHSSDWQNSQSATGSPFLGLPNTSLENQFYGPTVTPSLQHHGSMDDTYEMMQRSMNYQTGFVDFASEIWT